MLRNGKMNRDGMFGEFGGRFVPPALEGALSEREGIIPAVESAHAVAHAMKVAPTLHKDQVIIVNLSGRGDKDVAEVARLLGETL